MYFFYIVRQDGAHERVVAKVSSIQEVEMFVTLDNSRGQTIQAVERVFRNPLEHCRDLVVLSSDYALVGPEKGIRTRCGGPCCGGEERSVLARLA